VHALRAVRLVREYLVQVIESPRDVQLRDKIMLSCLHAGLAFSNAILGAVHAMAHSLGGYFDFAHGDCNALLLDSVIYYNFQAVPDRYRDIAGQMGISTENKSHSQVREELTESIVDLRREAGMNYTLSGLGLKREDIPVLAEMAINDACMLTNPRELSVAEVEEIYARAF
jgi:alcohol dehydrogenase class IV